MSSWSSSNFHGLYSALGTHFWWFLETAHLHVDHVAVYVSTEFVSWALIGISNALILAVWVLIVDIAHGMTVFTSSTHISVALAHLPYGS